MKTKFPKPLMDQMQTMQEEIEQRKQEAEKDTAAAWYLLLYILQEHCAEHELAYKERDQYRDAFDRISERFKAFSDVNLSIDKEVK